ncbi:uncharacterized protein STEHIDRAFT_171889 [Stereum hirsutum FP-91666 SS1]|uniref:uncharacterized protein n=1 Tax=Stereum hirsutum (strain FP-91666) TaxID=721885 RepID=UPI000444A471|nr:uncharacterized protein STEHIDRAFT_171889 [Stereum hirsutum FP-91666 SS1]EIM81578.1 hypothetical protein STEHIDRAFT_171889 [Stereum hirsutum FP-91666 SS1]
MDALSTQIQQLNTHEHTMPSTVPTCPMDRLPVELLIECFMYTAHTAPLTPVSLTGVCRHWNSVLSRNPRLFHLIPVDDTTFSLDTTRRLSQYYLERSKRTAFDVHLNVASRDSFITLLAPFFGELSRWRSLTIGPIGEWKEERVTFFGMWAPEVKDQFLEELSLNVVEEVELEDIIKNVPPQDENGEYPKTFIPRQPNHLLMSNVVSALPLSLPTPLRITSLYLTDGPTYIFNVNINPIDLLRFLNCCPELEFLSFTGSMVEKEPRPEDVKRGAPMANLPNLRSLVLHRTLCTRVILSYINCPKLEELYLEHLNVDFEFATHNPYLPRGPRNASATLPPSSEIASADLLVTHPIVSNPSSALPPSPALPSPVPNIAPTANFAFATNTPPDPDAPNVPDANDDDLNIMLIDAVSDIDLSSLHYAEEEGDSDDEFPDFSQSPFSDHATGMGLRSLLTRCNPPLKVLEMDYADMRTKDFEWFFGRADRLEEFRIVASDMSDRVMSRFAPFDFDITPPSSPEPEEAEHLLREDPEEFERIRMSRREPIEITGLRMSCLKRLELYNCQVVSGEAIVDALTRRCRAADDFPTWPSSAGWSERQNWRRLEHVAVVGCGKFGQTHAMELTDLLGDRVSFV